MKILVINPGSTSTKLAVFEDDRELVSSSVSHGEEILAFKGIFDQYDYRLGLVQDFLKENGIALADLDAVCGRGGLVRPIPCGTYAVTDDMIDDLKAEVCGRHASNLGPALAQGIGQAVGIPAYIVDPITVDELQPVARLTGMPQIMRESRCHTLNMKAVARQAAQAMGKRYEEVNFIVVHLGTGTSIAAHDHGRMIDMCDARGEGPMSCDRFGAVNTYLALEDALSRDNSVDEAFMRNMYTRGGLYAHLGTKDVREIERRIAEGDKYAGLVLDTMIYQCAKEIGAQAAALRGKVDRIIVTGGIAYDDRLMQSLKDQVGWIAPVVLMPGEEEMKALALGALRVLKGEEPARDYKKEADALQASITAK
jgi:butyrate kinase